MYLKRISMQGFKSFSDRVSFDFSPGVTCVVGPNGCGKSNIVDAFKWVLGEQSAKQLRGRQMQDMIFNGSSTRRSSGMAEVDLVFDNDDGTLPIDQKEVCVTRKLYRSGESEYLINNRVARLKDIRDLFLDTGVGADTYSMMEQGKVDVLLTSSSIERRAIFEEAAGIGKYKVRKREAERKLERTQQNLLRIDDIVEEVEKRLRSVKLQAGKARNYQVYDTRLKELRSGHSLAEYHRLTETVDRLTRESGEASDACTAIRTEIDRNESQATQILEQIDRVGEDLSALERELMDTRSEIAQQEERLTASQKRVDEQRSSAGRAEERLEQLSTEREQSRAQLKELSDSAVDLQDETHALTAAVRESVAREQELARSLTKAQAVLEDEKAGLIDLMRRSSQLRNEIAGLGQHRQTLRAEHGRLDERKTAITQRLEEYIVRRNSLESRLSELEELIASETTRLEEKAIEFDRMTSRRAELASQLGGARENRSALQSRLEVIDELERKMEGVGAGVRTLLDRKAASPEDPTLACIHGMVGGLFEVDVKYAHVIEAAVGEFDQHLVVSDAAGFAACRNMFDSLPGRISAFCLDRLPPLINERNLSEQPGFVAHAVDLVRFDESFARVARHLLDKTIVVDTLENALAMAGRDVADRRFVTMAGEVVEPNGAVSIGPPSSRAGLITRKSERRAIAAKLEATQSLIASLEEDINRTEAELNHLNTVRQDLQRAVNEANTGRAEATAGLDEVRASIDRLTQEQPLIAGEVAMIEQQIAEAAARESESAETVSRLDQENEARERTVEEHAAGIEELATQRESARKTVTDARVKLSALTEKRTALADAIHQLRRTMQSADEAISHVIQERDVASSRIAESEEVILAARERLDELGSGADRLEAGAIQLRRQREMLRLESEQLAGSTRESRTKLEGLETRLHEIQIEMHESAVRRDELTIRVREELDIDLADAYERYEHSEQDTEAVETEIEDLRRKIQRLGNVNLDAINELDELETREAFLTTQRSDLNDSRKQLEDLISKLDDESIDRFKVSFELIRENFRDLFRKLFGGGKADIILDNPDDILESGIEILAKPPGKELQRISLMSGGEKTMTAIALLMSIFRSRPSPLAILDEVDAALDEANNERFNAIIQDFLEHSQFLIVTHSKRTMAIADQLYGITMQEPGVSTPVSVKFEQADTAVA
jgi:chromosome segregation protein